MVKIIFLILLSCLFLVSCSEQKKSCEIGKPYPAWKEGEVESHHIYTGRGESNFFILPDGISILIDAGDYDPDNYLLMTPALPDTTCRISEWIARHIERVNPYKEHVNYFLLSHFHSDHADEGKMINLQTSDCNPNYILSRICETTEYIHFDKLIDRDYPRYNFPCKDDTDVDFVNYQNFVDWSVKSGNIQAERFEVGHNNQFVLCYHKSQFPDFKIQNIVANGTVWTGKGTKVDSLIFNKNKNRYCEYNENTLSCGIRLSYGAFRYYTQVI